MDLEIINVLEKLEKNGFEAYLVGGFVRDYLLGINSLDIDICTNALPKDIISIFNIKQDTVNYGSVSIQSNKYNFDITTYRKEFFYKNRRPDKIEYTNNLLLDVERRDFTINALYMNKEGIVLDFLSGKEDLNNRIIKCVGNTYEKLTEDPLRVLRAIRFAVLLDFNLDNSILDFITNHKDIIKTLSYTRKKEELDKIFSSKNVIKGLELLKKLDLLYVLEIDYDKIIEVPDLLGIWAQINFSKDYPFTKNNLVIIEKIRKIVNNGEINNYTLFKNGLYISLVAGEILGYDKKKLTEEYNILPIKSISELKINNNDIMDILNIEPNEKLKIIYEDIVKNVINQSINNDFEEIKKYILTNWK